MSRASGFLANTYPDYVEGTQSDYLDKEGNIKPEIIASATNLLNTLHPKLKASLSQFDSTSDYTIYTGYCGIAYLYFNDYIKRNSGESFILARDLTEKAINNLKREKISFLTGDAGPLALGILLFSKEDRDEEVFNLTNRLISLPEQISRFPEEFLDGRAGYIYSLLFVNKHLKRGIPIEHIKKQLNLMIQSGVSKANAEQFECPLKYKWEGDVYLGAAHGIAGILYVILLGKRLISQDDLNSVIKPTLDWLITQRYQRTGNFLTTKSSKVDKLVQWCHGAPGFVPLLILASEVFPTAPYFKIALECSEIVWNTGILAKGYSICHGVSGNGYTFAQLYKATKKLQHLHRLACFLHWSSEFPKQQGMKPDNPFSLFEGISGLIYFLTDVQDVSNSAFPAFELNNL